jgi:AraC-like DNA-binding protein
MFKMKLEHFSNDNSFPFFIQYGFHSGDFFPHIHEDFTELVIVMEGSSSHVVGKESYIIKKGDVFVIGSQTTHEFKNSNNFRLCNIMFRPDFFFSNTHDIKKSTGFHALFFIEPFLSKEYEFKSKLRLNLDYYLKASEIIEELMLEFYGQLDGRKEALTSGFMKLVLFLSRKYKLPEASNNTDVLLIANAVSYIEKNYTDPLSIKNLASLACLSERHFARIFKDSYQITPIQYIIGLRLMHAANLLKNTQASITEISILSGFSDNNYFARKFKSTYGCSPGEYRKKEASNYKTGN